MFLQTIAKKYIEKYGDEIHHITFVFPNNRAGLFFKKFLSENTSKPVLSPRIITINALFEELALRLPKPLHKDEPLQQLFTLFRIYQQKHPEETLDRFIFWGRMLLGDFNEVDQYLVDPKKVFTNVRDLKNLSFFTSEDDHLLRETFFDVFYKNDKEASVEGNVKTSFISFWDEIYELYYTHKQQTLESGYVQEGLLQREVAEHLSEIVNEKFLLQHYVFIGFNALTKVERALMTFVRTNIQLPGRVDFHWDYNLPKELSDNEALQYKAANEKHYPASDDISIKVEPNIPHIKLIKVASTTGQTAVIQHYLHQNNFVKDADLTKTAIVLPDESMLIPTLYSVDGVENHFPINVTMGYSIMLTSVFTLIKHLAQLQQTIRMREEDILFYHKPTLSILHALNFDGQYETLINTIINENKTYIEEKFFANDELLNLVFKRNSSAIDALEYVGTILNHLKAYYDNDFELEPLKLAEQKLTLLKQLWTADLATDANTFYRLYAEVLSGINIPFKGEPLRGIQIMGVLETRALDFDNVFIMSVNEDVFPKHNTNNSFIPAELRKAFDLPLTENRDGIFAYNFYRMLFHAKNVYLIQNTLSNDLTSGEVSRYVHQLTYLYYDKITIENEDGVFGKIAVNESNNLEIKKTSMVLDNLKSYMKSGMSPSAIKNYVKCPLMFYLAHVMKLKENEIEEDLQAYELGNVVHMALEKLYNRNQIISEKVIDEFIAMVQKTDFIERIYLNVKFKDETESQFSLLEGRDKMYIKVAKQYVISVLKHEKAICKENVVKDALCELQVRCYPIKDNKDICLRGFVDHIDTIETAQGVFSRLIDYKTGATKCKVKEISELFTSSKTENALQILLYAYMLKHNSTKTDKNGNAIPPFNKPILPHIYGVKQMISGRATETLVLPNGVSFDTIEEEFEKYLHNLINDILDENKPFSRPMNMNDDDCKYCQFKSICGVKAKSY